MKTSRVSIVIAAAMCVVCGLAGAAFGQVIAPAQTAAEAARAGSVRSRSPGQMVGAGLAAARNAADVARGGVTIVETSRPSSRLSLLIANTVADLFEQLNQLITGFDLLLRQRAGAPVSATDLSQSTTGGTGGRPPGR